MAGSSQQTLKALAKALQEAAAAQAPDEKKDDAASAADPSDREAEAIKTGLEEIRTHLRRMGAGLGAAAGVVIGGLGWAQVHEAFPIPEGRIPFLWGSPQRPTLILLLLASSLLAVGGAAWLAARFFAAQARIVMASNPDPQNDFKNAAERHVRDRVFELIAAEETAPSLDALELRAMRFERLAAAGPDWSHLAGEAKRLRARIRLALHRGALKVLELRASDAHRGWRSVAALAMTVVGLVGVFGVADYAKGERALIQLRAACQKAVDEGALDACDPVRKRADRTAPGVIAKLKAEIEKWKTAAELASARLVLTGAPPTTVLEQIKWFESCTVVLQANEQLEGTPNLVALCASVLPD